MANNKATSLTSSCFGKMGWFMIIYIGVLLFLAGFMVGDGFNILLPTFGESGLILPELLKFITVGQMIALVYGVFTIFIIRKIGPRMMSTASLIIMGLIAIFWGRSASTGQWAVCYIIIQCCVQMITANASMTLAANWWPKKKGLALGWATMGSNVGSAISVYLWTFIFSRFGGLKGGMLAVGVIIMVFAVITFFIFRDVPEHMGLTPDNMPMTEEEIAASRAKFEEKEKLHIGELLKQRNFWVDAVLFGVMGMVCAGLVSQMVTGLTQVGIEYDRAVFLFFVAGLIAIAMSYLFGWLDVKIGTKMATFLLGICFALGAACLVGTQAIEPLVYPACILIAGGIGGYVNLMPSMCGTIFGRKKFVEAYGIATLITGLIRSTIFSIMSFTLVKFGSYILSYKLMIVLALVSAFMVFLFKEKDFAVNKGEEV